ncbi:MAG TPA: tRNA lysidine(34) synthetase TilS [Gemmatimonadales bacterium]
MNDLPERVAAAAHEANLFPGEGTLLVAVSGGPDSVALLDIVMHDALRVRFGLVVEVAHVDHGIAPDSAAIAERVERLAAGYGVPVHRSPLTLGSLATETEARAARYPVLREMQRWVGARYLATGHHRDDQVETVLHRFLRGTGPAGLAGIPARGSHGLVRPLLPFARAELAAHLVHRGITPPAVADPANVGVRHVRTWLRHEILPRLRSQMEASVDLGVEAVARQAASDRVAWRRLLRVLPELQFRRDSRGIEVARLPLTSYDKALSEALLRALGRELGLVIGTRGAARLRDFVQRAPSGRRCQLGGGSEAEVVFDRVRLYPMSRATPPPTAEVDLTAPGRLRWGVWEFRWLLEPARASQRVAAATWIRPGLVRVRAARPGDRVAPVRGVGRRKVRRLLSEAHVPASLRKGYPVIEREGAIVWIPGICRGATGLPEEGEPAVRLEVRDRGDVAHS